MSRHCFLFVNFWDDTNGQHVLESAKTLIQAIASSIYRIPAKLGIRVATKLTGSSQSR